MFSVSVHPGLFPVSLKAIFKAFSGIIEWGDASGAVFLPDKNAAPLGYKGFMAAFREDAASLAASTASGVPVFVLMMAVSELHIAWDCSL
jgi:hypothetical protein